MTANGSRITMAQVSTMNCTKSVTATAHNPPISVYASMMPPDTTMLVRMPIPRPTDRNVPVAISLSASSNTRTGTPCQANNCRTVGL